MQESISVVIPLYNKESLIQKAIDSVAHQSLPPKELIVVDDGSTDSSKQIVLDLFSQYKKSGSSISFIYLAQSNQGVSQARNKGIANISSKYVALLDADDSYEQKFLETINTLIVKYKHAGVFVTGYQFQRENTPPKPATWIQRHSNTQDGIFESYFSLAASGDLPVSASSVCIDTQVLKKVGGFPTGQHMGEDQWVWSLLALRCSIAFSTSVQSNYCVAANNSLMDTIPPTSELPFSSMLRDLLDHRLKKDECKASVKAYLRTHLYDLVRRNHHCGNIQASFDLLRDDRLEWWRARSIYWFLSCIIADQKSIFGITHP